MHINIMMIIILIFFFCIFSSSLSFIFVLGMLLFIDLIWCFFWKSQWDYLQEDIESGIHGLVIFLSWIGILLKIIIEVFIAVSEINALKGTLPKRLGEKLNSEYLPQIDDGN